MQGKPVILGGLLEHGWAAREWLRDGEGFLRNLTAATATADAVPAEEEEGSLGLAFLRLELQRSLRQQRNQYLNLDYTPKDGPTREAVIAAYETPSIFRGDMLRSACHPSLPHRWVMASAPGSGSVWHVDPFNASAWNALLLGRKRWALWPPGLGTPPLPPPTTTDEEMPITNDYFNPDRNRGGWWGITQPYERQLPTPRQYFEDFLSPLEKNQPSEPPGENSDRQQQQQAQGGREHLLRVRLHIIRNERLENIGKSQSCMFSKLRIIWKQTERGCVGG